MNISCERPYALFAILIIIPVLILIAIHNRKANYASGFSNSKGSAFVKRLFNIQKMIFIRSLFIALAWCMLVLAYAKISWGTYLMPVQKNGTAVSFVFDISSVCLQRTDQKKIRVLRRLRFTYRSCWTIWKAFPVLLFLQREMV